MCLLSIKMVPRAGVEPTLANYLLHTGYKSAVLPLNYRGKELERAKRLELSTSTLARLHSTN